MCVQRKAPKCIPTEDDIMLSNINSFGNAVGEITNKITTMFDVQANFDVGSREYNILDYRIKCGQLYQQNAIDKTKGIEAKPMSDKWSNWIANKVSNGKDNDEKRQNWINRQILADKKPYFMQYVYPSERTKMNEYIKKNNEKCIMRFRITLDELLAKKNLTINEKKFVHFYYQKMPLGMSPCTINRICWKIESLFDGFKIENPENFDYSIMKSDNSYSTQLYDKIKKIYERYRRETANYMQYAKSERIKSDERQIQKYIFKEEFKRQCLKECPNEDMLCNIVLDLCYRKSKYSKQFAWDISGGVFVKNLLKRNNYMITYPEHDKNGDINFNGEHFSMKTAKINVTVDMEGTECQ